MPFKKVIVLGDSGIGKSTYLNHLSGKYSPLQTRATIGVGFTMSGFDDEKLGFWDLSGEKRFAWMHAKLIQGSCAAILMFSLKDRASFDSLDYWYERITTFAKDNMPIMLIGLRPTLAHTVMKTCLPQVTEEEIHTFSKNHQIDMSFIVDLEKINTLERPMEWLSNCLYSKEQINETTPKPSLFDSELSAYIHKNKGYHLHFFSCLREKHNKDVKEILQKYRNHRYYTLDDSISALEQLPRNACLNNLIARIRAQIEWEELKEFPPALGPT